MGLYSGILSLLTAAALQQPGGAVLRGTVRGQADGAAEPLPYAVIEVVGARSTLTTIADVDGGYAVRGLARGRTQLRVLHLGYRTLEVEVLVAGDTLALDFELQPEPVALAPIMVRADLPLPVIDSIPVPSPGSDLAEAAIRALEASPGIAEAGLVQVAREAAGGEPADPSAVLFMRGATTDLKLVLLDGAPVYTPFHVGGLLPSFDAALLEDASLYVGGAPARYDGGLSYILDLRTRRPRRDRLHSSGSLDLMSGRIALDVPLGERAGLTFASRALHPLSHGIVWDGQSPYGYGEALARLDLEPGAEHQLSATGFWNRESVFLDLGAARGSPQTTSVPDDARWGNGALTFNYRAQLGETAAAIGAAFTRYNAQLPLSDSTSRLARGATDRLRLTLDLRRNVGESTLRFGGSYDALTTDYSAPAVGSGGVDVSARADGSVAGAYIEGERPLGPEFRLRSGVRLDHFSGESGLRLAPRFALTWLLTENAVVTLAVGRYHQHASAPDTLVHLVLADSARRPQGPLLPVAAASHVVLSLDQVLSPEVRLGLEGFVKRFSGTSGPGATVLNASGVDLRVLRATDRMSAWLGYTLTWYWQPATGQTAGFQGRHLLSTGITGRLSESTGVDLRLAYGDGLPYTPIPVADRAAPATGEYRPETLTTSTAGRQTVDGGAPLTGGLTDDFLRVDAEIFATLRPRWNGRAMQVRPYVKLLNALNRRDALFYYFERWRDPEVRPLAELSLIPVLGLEWRF